MCTIMMKQLIEECTGLHVKPNMISPRINFLGLYTCTVHVHACTVHTNTAQTHVPG